MPKHKDWLSIAQEDLDSAKHLFSIPFMTALFHLQQCAEKSLKAYLVHKKGLLIKTHDLPRLIDACVVIDQNFEMLRLPANILTKYETSGRYPDPLFIKPNIEQILELTEHSEFVFNYVMQRID